MTVHKYHTIQRVHDPILSRTTRGYKNCELNKSFNSFRLIGFSVRGPEFSSISTSSLLLTWASYVINQ